MAPPADEITGSDGPTPAVSRFDEKNRKDTTTTTTSAASLTGDDLVLGKGDEKVGVHDATTHSDSEAEGYVDPATDFQDKEHVIIKTGADASGHLLPLRDDYDPALTFRGLFLATALSAFQAVMSQIYFYKPTYQSVQGTFIVLIAYFLGEAWAKFLPRGDLAETRWRAKGGVGTLPAWIRVLKFVNNGPWSLKEHAVCALTANSASNAASATQVFAAQYLFYGVPFEATTVILSTLSIGLFGYGLCGIFRPITVFHVEAVYWGNLPLVKTLQGMHWQKVKNSKPIRYFWYAFGSMFLWEPLPSYIWPWLNSVSIPCLASMNATGNTASILTNIFGGAENNEGLGLFSLSFDWQYTTSYQTALPLKFQAHQAAGLITCFAVMLGIYYGNGWNAQSQPFMSTALRTQEGGRYPISKVFAGGILDHTAFAKYGPPALSASFAYAMFIANAAIGALIAHTILFWGRDIVRAIKSAAKGQYEDRHHAHMVKHYKEVSHWWYIAVLVISFVFGLIVVLRENVGLPVWAYVVALLLGSIVAPFSAILYSRFGNGIATNNLSKMIAGLMIPERPIGNMYFAAWSHSVIMNMINLSTDLKSGEYLKIPPRTMFLTQIWGTVFGGFINYAVMISIVPDNAALLAVGNGNASWSGATIQGFNTNAAAWAMAKYLYKTGAPYAMVPIGLVIGAAVVAVHRIIVHFWPRIHGFNLREINMPTFIQFAGYIPYNQSQTCVLLTWILSGFFTQFYLRNYKPRIFKDYMYLVTAAWDGGALFMLFILSFAVFGAGGPAVAFPQWWGNNVNGNYDLCPVPDS